MSGALSGALAAADLERVRRWIGAQPAQADPVPGITRADLRGALGVFLLVFASTFPVVLPFVFIADPGMAMLFLCGHAWGRHAGLKPWRAGVAMVLLGVLIEAVVLALGG